MKDRLPSLDILRLLAMVLVAAQHIQTACEVVPPQIFFHLDPGQFGVSLFLAISGFFAMRGEKSPTGKWLFKRLSRIFVPYWIAVAGILWMNYLARYKPVSLSLVIAEFLGIAGFTHPGRIVGIHLWFISLLLLCYVIAAALRSWPKLFPLLLAICVAWLWRHPFFAGHTLAFLTGAWIARKNQPSAKELSGLAIAAVILAAFVNSGFACGAVACLAFSTTLISLPLGEKSTNFLAKAAGYTYHFYLVHGPIYLGVAIKTGKSIAVTSVIGTVISIIVAIILWYVEQGIRHLFVNVRRTRSDLAVVGEQQK